MNKVECNYCHGTGIRYDITCADNVNAHRQASNPCRACDATGMVEPRPATPPLPRYEPQPLPDYLAWMA